MEGLCFGCFMGVYPGLTADHFGMRGNTLNYGIMFVGNSIGAVAGPSIMSTIHARTGSYRPAFIAAGALAVAGLILVLVYHRMVPTKESRYEIT